MNWFDKLLAATTAMGKARQSTAEIPQQILGQNQTYGKLEELRKSMGATGGSRRPVQQAEIQPAEIQEQIYAPQQQSRPFANPLQSSLPQMQQPYEMAQKQVQTLLGSGKRREAEAFMAQYPQYFKGRRQWQLL